MKAFRNLAFLALVGTMFFFDGRELLALGPPPPFYGCPDGCTCTVTWDNWLEVKGDCPDAAPIDVCSLIFGACETYCDELGWWLENADPGPDTYSCWYWELIGSCQGPYGLEPPTEEWICGCACWVS